MKKLFIVSLIAVLGQALGQTAEDEPQPAKAMGCSVKQLGDSTGPLKGSLV